jgi:hypothetical protein
LDQASLEAGDGERFHEMADEDVVEIVGDAPKEEQDGNQNEGDQVACGEQAGGVLG